MAKPAGEWEALVAGKGEGLARCRSHGTDCDHDEEKEDYDRHSSCPSYRAGCVLEDVDEWESGWRGECIRDVADAE